MAKRELGDPGPWREVARMALRKAAPATFSAAERRAITDEYHERCEAAAELLKTRCVDAVMAIPMPRDPEEVRATLERETEACGEAWLRAADALEARLTRAKVH